MKNTANYKITIFILLVCMILLSGCYYFLYHDIVNKNENNAKMLDYISSESSREAYAVSARKQLQSLDSDIKKVQGSIVGSGDVVLFIEKMESIARNNGLSITNDNIDEIVDPKLASTTAVNVLRVKSSTKGTWAGTYRFLAELESMPYKIKVNSLSVQNSSRQSSEDIVSTLNSQWESNFEIIVLKYK